MIFIEFENKSLFETRAFLLPEEVWRSMSSSSVIRPPNYLLHITLYHFMPDCDSQYQQVKAQSMAPTPIHSLCLLIFMRLLADRGPSQWHHLLLLKALT